MKVHQFVQSLVQHDAISTHARHLQRLLAEMDIDSHIYAGEQRAGRGAATYFRDYRTDEPADKTWLLYHLSIGGAVADFLATRPEHKAINYHNITPVDLFGPWEPRVGIELEAARRQLAELAPKTELGIGVSRYNERELKEAGYSKTTVAPVLFDPADFERELDTKAYARLMAAKESGGSDWLFVGRVAPHKGQTELVKAFAVYRQLYDPTARLHIVGGVSSHHYWTVLGRFLDALQLRDAVDLSGGVSNGELAAYYKAADVFVCMSQHEGFGVPLLEAMYNRLPVVAYGAAAIPETLGDGGLLLGDNSPALFAAAVERVLHDSQLASSLIAAGNERLKDFTLEHGRERWREVFTQMAEAA